MHRLVVVQLIAKREEQRHSVTSIKVGDTSISEVPDALQACYL